MLTINVDYEVSGFFDKDEQGWCSNRVTVSCQDGKLVTIRKYFDANGIIRSDMTLEAVVQNQEYNILYLQYLRDAKTVKFDLEKQRLIE
jgi:major membrane immunogen (membrane-anchored lipoprotein)